MKISEQRLTVSLLVALPVKQTDLLQLRTEPAVAPRFYALQPLQIYLQAILKYARSPFPNYELTTSAVHARYVLPASFGSRAELAKSSFKAAKATKKYAEAKKLMVIWTETVRLIVVFICSLYSMILVMRRQRLNISFAGEWPGRRVGKLGREHGLAATFSPQFSLIQDGR